MGLMITVGSFSKPEEAHLLRCRLEAAGIHISDPIGHPARRTKYACLRFGELTLQEGARLAWVEIAPGELIDKITILQIKMERITDPEKLELVEVELTTLGEARDGTIDPLYRRR